jgi:hypothetical protein
MPTMKLTNPLRALDLTKFDLHKINQNIKLPKIDFAKLDLRNNEVRETVERLGNDIARRLPVEQARKAVAPAAKVARDAAYVAVGVGVIAAQRVNARRYDARERLAGVKQRLDDTMPRVRDEAQSTAQRVIDEATAKVRGFMQRGDAKDETPEATTAV